MKFFFYIIISAIAVYYLINLTIGNNKLTKLKKYVSSENKFLIKKYFYPYSYISKLENEIVDFEEVKIFERIRDLNFYDNKLFLVLKDTPFIRVISLE